jgi:CRISPR system Cascade subunit CasE
MMHLSKLVLNPRSRDVRRDLASPYNLHRTILRAFPDAQDGGPGRVLFRVEELRRTGEIVALIQSAQKPHWSRLDALPGYLLPTNGTPNPLSKEFSPRFREGQLLAFRLLANPTIKRNGKRLGLLREEDQMAWLKRKADAAGFDLLSATAVPEGLVRDEKSKDGQRLTFLGVRFDGVLRVTDPKTFLRALENGIGSAKGLGFGMLSIGPPK